MCIRNESQLKLISNFNKKNQTEPTCQPIQQRYKSTNYTKWSSQWNWNKWNFSMWWSHANTHTLTYTHINIECHIRMKLKAIANSQYWVWLLAFSMQCHSNRLDPISSNNKSKHVFLHFPHIHKSVCMRLHCAKKKTSDSFFFFFDLQCVFRV